VVVPMTASSTGMSISGKAKAVIVLEDPAMVVVLAQSLGQNGEQTPMLNVSLEMKLPLEVGLGMEGEWEREENTKKARGAGWCSLLILGSLTFLCV
jgi:hypothetical protein